MKRAQRDLILDLLRERGREGITLFDVMAPPIASTRLAARIEELRKVGYNIETIDERSANRKRHARYVLHEVGSSVTTGQQLDWWTTT